MDLKEKLISSFLAFENNLNTDIDSDLHKIRTEAIQTFESQGFPTKKNENWKYTSLNRILKNDYNIFPDSENKLELNEVRPYFLHQIDSYKIVFIDGVYSSFLSELSHEDLEICLISSAIKKPKYKMVIDHYFNTIATKSESLTNLNTAFSKEGVYINIPKSKVVSKPIQIIHFSTGNEQNILLQPRNLIVVGENSHVQIIEKHQSLTEQNTLTNCVTEIFAHKRAIIDYYKIQNDKSNASLIDSTYISQKQNSIVSVNSFSFGGKLTRNNIVCFQNGEYATTNLNGITIIGDKQHVDQTTFIEHKVPNCQSNQMYKGIFADKSTGVFNGKVVVRKDAQKTNAIQQTNNILLNDGAKIDAKPHLEIFADDVKCSHGCTIGQLDEKSLFYLRSRGIPKNVAKALLLYAFSNDVLEKIKIPELKIQINTLIAEKLGVSLGFHL